MAEPLNMSDFSSSEKLLLIFEYKFVDSVISIAPGFSPERKNLFSDCVGHVLKEYPDFNARQDYEGILIVRNLTNPQIANYFNLSICSFLNCQEAFNQNKVIVAAGYLSKAHYYLGMAEGMNLNRALHDEAQKILENRRQLGSKGGREKSKPYADVIRYIGILLKELRPVSGWKSKNEASLTIAEKLLTEGGFPGKRKADPSDESTRVVNYVYKQLTNKTSPLFHSWAQL